MERNKRIIAKTIAIVAVLLVVYIFLPMISSLIYHPPGSMYMVLPKKVKFEFERVINISARTVMLNITLPQNSEYQKVVMSSISSVTPTKHESYNRTWLTYKFKGSAHIVLKYNGTTIMKKWYIENSDDTKAIPQNLKDQYDHDEYLLRYNDTTKKYQKVYVISPSAFEKKKIGEQITSGKHSVVEKLRAIYDVIVQNFRYKTERSGLPHTAVETWNDREGDCDELSFVFVSLARSVGIPAWVEYGWLYNGHGWEQHAWVRTVVPHDGKLEYVNIDVTVEVGRKDYGMGFMIRDPYRFTEWCDDGNSEHLSAYYNFIHYTTPPSFNYDESVKTIKIIELDKENVYVGGQTPSWLMIIIFTAIIGAVIAIIIRW